MINPLIWRSIEKCPKLRSLSALNCLASQPYLSSDNRCPRWHHTPFPTTICRDTQGQSGLGTDWDMVRDCKMKHHGCQEGNKKIHQRTSKTSQGIVKVWWSVSCKFECRCQRCRVSTLANCGLPTSWPFRVRQDLGWSRLESQHQCQSSAPSSAPSRWHSAQALRMESTGETCGEWTKIPDIYL